MSSQSPGDFIGSVGIGVIGAQSMVAERAMLPAIEASPAAHVAATSSRSGPVPRRWAPTSVSSYQQVLDHPDVEAVYIPLPNDLHREWTLRAAAAGKHVLCEKPIATSGGDARSMADACDAAGVLLAEAWMTPFDPRWSTAFDLVRDGLIGDVLEIDASFTFTIGPEAIDNYRWSVAHGGGALLDVGIYCVGPAATLWGTDAEVAGVERIVAESGVDASTRATLRWPDGQVATVHCSFIDDEHQNLTYRGTTGSIALVNDAHTGGERARVITHTNGDGVAHSIGVESHDPYTALVDAFADAVRGTARWARSVERSAELLELLTRISDTASAPT